jgi:hypothetical protein
MVPTCIEEISSGTTGKKYPKTIPTPMAKKIHKVKNLSKKDNLFMLTLFL